MENNSSDPKAGLFWPGLWFSGMTHPALPAISAFLKNNGIDTDIDDLNMGYISYTLSIKYIQNCVVKLKKGLSFVKKGSYQYKHIIFALSLAEKIEQDIPHAIEILRKDDPKRKKWAEKIVNSAFYVVRSAHRSFALNLTEGFCGIPFKTFSKMENFIVERKNDNPFYDYIRNVVRDKFDIKERYIFGISLSGISQLIFTYTLAKELKKTCPKCKVVIGGAYVPILVEAIKDINEREYLFKDVDAYVVGSGEKPFLEYIRYVSAHTQNSSPLDGIIYKDGKDYVYFEKEGKPLTSREFVVPDYSYLKKVPYPLGGREYAIEVSRGCYWGKCTFCANRFGSNSQYHPVNIKTIISSVEYLRRKFNAKNIFFSSLAATPLILEQIAKSLLKSKIRIRWRSWCRIEEGLTDKRLRLFKKSGCKKLLCAPESFDDKTLALMNKGVTSRLNKTILLRFHRHRLLESPNFICGFPGETKKNIINTVKFAKRHRLNIHFFPFYVPKRSIIAENPRDFGIKLLKTSHIRTKYHFRFLRTDCLCTAADAFGNIEKAYPENIDILDGRSVVDAVLVLFKKRRGKGPRCDRLNMSLRPYILESYMLVGSKGNYWVFNSTYGSIHELNEASYDFLSFCNGRKNLKKICELMGFGSDLKAIKPFFKLAKMNNLIAVK